MEDILCQLILSKVYSEGNSLTLASAEPENRGIQIMKLCTRCGSARFNSWNRCMDCRNRRARTRMRRLSDNGGSHTERQWQELLASTPRCVECSRLWSEIPPRPDGRYRNTWTKGHKLAVYHGGTHEISNIQAECYQCNFRKNAGRLRRPAPA